MSEKIMSGRELRERLFQTTEDSKRMELLCELVARQQEDLFFLDKRLMETAQYLDKLADILVNLTTGTSVLATKLAPFLKEVKDNVNIAKSTVEADNHG